MTADNPHTGHYKTSILQTFAQDALDNGRPVLIVPSTDTDTANGGLQLSHDENGRQMAYIPEGIAVVFVGSEGFACATSLVAAAEFLPQSVASNPPSRVMGGALSDEDRLQAQQSLHGPAPKSADPGEAPGTTETERD